MSSYHSSYSRWMIVHCQDRTEELLRFILYHGAHTSYRVFVMVVQLLFKTRGCAQLSIDGDVDILPGQRNTLCRGFITWCTDRELVGAGKELRRTIPTVVIGRSPPSIARTPRARQCYGRASNRLAALAYEPTGK